MSTHSTRIRTGLVLAILAIVSVFYFSNFLFGLLCLLIISAAFWEWLDLVKIQMTTNKLMLLVLFWISLIVLHHHLMITLQVVVIWWVLALIMLFVPIGNLQFLRYKGVALLVGFILLAPTWVAAVNLHMANRLVLFYLIMLVSFADTAAYFVGSRYGKHHLIPHISPKKSVEGLLGGIVVGVIAGLLEVLFMPNLSLEKILFWSALGVALILVSVVGDLFESLMKRIYEVKDSGSFLPGHGGLLDRVDSQTSAMPIFLLICITFSLF